MAIIHDNEDHEEDVKLVEDMKTFLKNKGVEVATLDDIIPGMSKYLCLTLTFVLISYLVFILQ